MIEINLRLPSMLHGKKGFERIVWAFKNVLNQSLAWLFVDLGESAGGDAPIKQHHPFEYGVDAVVTTLDGIVTPNLPAGKLLDLEGAEEVLEWLSMLSLESPRVRAHDNMDSFLCRYQLSGPDESGQISSLLKLRWHGFAPSEFVMTIFNHALEASKSKFSWVALMACGFERQSYTILCVEGREFLCWECRD